MYYLYVLAGIALVSGILFIESKIRSANKRHFFAPIIIAVLFTVRYFFGSREINNVIGLTASPLSPLITALSVIFMWMGIAAILIVILQFFYDIATLNNLVRFFATPVLIVNLILLIPNIKLFSSFGEALSVSGVAFAAESGAALTICVYSWLKNKKDKLDKKAIKNLILAVAAVLLATMPAYVPQVLFGYANPLLDVRDITPVHRIFLYFSVIIPVSLYFILRNKEERVKEFSMVFISLATMITYSYDYVAADILNPLNLPLHLCNTAMYIIPICLIFKWDKLFYFTYFINVLGAFLAMAMPNYADGTNIFSVEMMIFWVNHYCAFFMPLLIVAFGIFKRPTLRQFKYSMVGFAVYFVFIMIVNGWFSNYGEVDYFFLNSNFIVDKLGVWAENTRLLKWEFDLGELHFVYYPIYQSLFFCVYVLAALAMWFLYEQFFALSEFYFELFGKYKKIRLDKFAIMSQLDGRIGEPMYEKESDKLILENFGKRYGTSDVYAVRNADLEVHAGEIFGFLGPNGAGKSTIIKSIVGIQPITEGCIKVCGFDAEKQPVEAKRNIGFVPDHYALYEALTGREYINYIADIYDVSTEDRNARMEKYVTLFEMEGAMDNRIRTYSHGMKQKITIMAALVHNPKVWILDEPLTGLDPNSIFQVKECMRLHAREGNIVFFSSHIIDVVEKICDRITIIKKGRILCTRKTSEFNGNDTLEKFYLKTIEENDIQRETVESKKEKRKV